MKDIDYSYEYEDGDGKYCYPKTNVLRNKFDIKNIEELRSAERELSMARYFSMEAKGVTGDFSLEHLKSIHKWLFQDIYTWAGEIRTVDISKGTIFCLVQFIEPQFEIIFQWLTTQNFLADVKDKEEMSKKVAYLLGELNMIHPFREGNGRTQRMYIEQICKNNGRFEINFSRATKEEMLQASIDTSLCDCLSMEKLIYNCLQEL